MTISNLIEYFDASYGQPPAIGGYRAATYWERLQ
jgi:hypothetical protein